MARYGAFRRFTRDEAGNYAILTALVMPILLGTGALGSEVGLWLYTHQAMQGAADIASLSAATAYFVQGNASGLLVEAEAATASYGFIDGEKNVTVTVHQPPSSGTHTSVTEAVEVIVKQPISPMLAKLFIWRPIMISARAVAMAPGGLGCVLSLDPSASSATVIKGTASVVLDGCSLDDNSNSSSALTLNGGGSAKSVNVVGGIAGASNITTTNGTNTGVEPISDPYASTSYPPFLGCDTRSFSSKITQTINPGVYCGGLTFNAGANVTLNPGVYYVDQGSFKVNAGATLSGNGVTIVFTSSTGNNYATATINGGATVNLSAPTSGSTAGIVFFADRNMPVGSSFSFEGGASQDIAGALYMPKAAVKFAGGSSTGTACTQLVADTITFTGNSSFAINCTGYGTKAIGSTVATLVE